MKIWAADPWPADQRVRPVRGVIGGLRRRRPWPPQCPIRPGPPAAPTTATTASPPVRPRQRGHARQLLYPPSRISQISYGSGRDTRTCNYDTLHQLTTDTLATGAGHTVASISYQYDPNGNLTSKNTTGVGASGGGSGTLALTDQHTDVVGNFSPTSSSLTGDTVYSPLGAVVSTTGMAGKLGFQSGWTDPANGRVSMGARWYDPAAGQFTSRDTAKVNPDPDSAAANPFAYTGDDPLTAIDPTGHATAMLGGRRRRRHPAPHQGSPRRRRSRSRRSRPRPTPGARQRPSQRLTRSPTPPPGRPRPSAPPATRSATGSGSAARYSPSSPAARTSFRRLTRRSRTSRRTSSRSSAP